MAYTPTEWKKGDTITAALLNHAEQGIAANDAAIADLASLNVVFSGTEGTITASATFDEIVAAFEKGVYIYGTVASEGEAVVTEIYHLDSIYDDSPLNRMTFTTIPHIESAEGVSASRFVIAADDTITYYADVYPTIG